MGPLGRVCALDPKTFTPPWRGPTKETRDRRRQRRQEKKETDRRESMLEEEGGEGNAILKKNLGGGSLPVVPDQEV